MGKKLPKKQPKNKPKKLQRKKEKEKGKISPHLKANLHSVKINQNQNHNPKNLIKRRRSQSQSNPKLLQKLEMDILLSSYKNSMNFVKNIRRRLSMNLKKF